MASNNKKRKRLLVVDFDGTFFEDFFEVDRKIIKEVFQSKIVLFIDNIARKINDLGVVKNTTRIFKLRLFVYSCLSLKNYFKAKEEYKKRYVNAANNAIVEVQKKLSILYPNVFYHKSFEENGKKGKNDEDKIGYIILSNNDFSSSIKAEYQILVDHNKSRLLINIKEKFKDYDICMVGDSMLDDIIPAKVLKLGYIYIKRNATKEKNTFLVNKKAKVTTLENAVKVYLNES